MIRTENLTKRFGPTVAVKELHLSVREGTIFGLVGPNGAGKTTTLAMLATLLRPSAGRAIVGGYDVATQPDRVRRIVGYSPDHFGFADDLKVTEYLDFYGACYGMGRAERARRIPDVLERVGLAEKADAYVDRLSRGMKQRLGLARCLLHDPAVLILDEPASGLDPGTRVQFRALLKSLRDEGKTILISSHILLELADLCDEVGIMAGGTLVAAGSIAEMLARASGEQRLHIELLEGVTEAAAWLAARDGVKRVEREGRTLTVAFDGDEAHQAALLQAMVSAGFRVLCFQPAVRTLEEVFLSVTGEGKR
ncbi:MAG: ABC transporter ATP-binding protein [Bacillota bacterium]|jgi:ABC-type multidrug transport system, ATPase component|nr:ABC transporter ATP-binding protein [Bacillota bacterium]